MRKLGSIFVLTLTLGVFPAVVAAGTPTEHLANQVRHELVMLPYYSVFDNLMFTVEGDTVVLRGQVNRPTLKRDAERVVRRIEGVSTVVNEIEVLPMSFHDDRIRVAVLRAIYSQPALQKYGVGAHASIRVIVKNGDVFLEGVVLNRGDSDIAFLQANGVSGVFSVTNNLRIENEARGKSNFARVLKPAA